MGGPNLEIFKFTLYLIVPIAALIHFGNPEWYRTTVVPVGIVADGVLVFVFTFPLLQYRDKLFSANRGNQVFSLRVQIFIYFLSFVQWIPKDQNGVREELARIKAERLVKQAQRELESEAEKNSKS